MKKKAFKKWEFDIKKSIIIHIPDESYIHCTTNLALGKYTKQ